MEWSTWHQRNTFTETSLLGTACELSFGSIKRQLMAIYLYCRIDSHFLIKITDFGLSEDVFVRNYFRQGSGEELVKLPVKWMAPESLSDGHFSEKSDVVCVLLVDNHPLIYARVTVPSMCLCSGPMV